MNQGNQIKENEEKIELCLEDIKGAWIESLRKAKTETRKRRALVIHSKERQRAKDHINTILSSITLYIKENYYPTDPITTSDIEETLYSANQNY